MKIQKANK